MDAYTVIIMCLSEGIFFTHTKLHYIASCNMGTSGLPDTIKNHAYHTQSTRVEGIYYQANIECPCYVPLV